MFDKVVEFLDLIGIVASLIKLGIASMAIGGIANGALCGGKRRGCWLPAFH
jgi:hypothetical protein